MIRISHKDDSEFWSVNRLFLAVCLTAPLKKKKKKKSVEQHKAHEIKPFAHQRSVSYCLIAIMTNAFQSNCFDILLTKNRLSHHREMFSDLTSRSSHPELFCKKDCLKDFAMQYSHENTCVGVSFNKISGLKPPTQVFFCEYCKIFKNSFFYRPTFRRATRSVEGETSPAPF